MSSHFVICHITADISVLIGKSKNMSIMADHNHSNLGSAVMAQMLIRVPVYRETCSIRHGNGLMSLPRL
jgi:hypothetical protein